MVIAQPDCNAKAVLPEYLVLESNEGIYTNVVSIFVDLRSSTKLFSGKYSKRRVVARQIRCFVSETVRILKEAKGFKEIGVRGDCVYGIYYMPNDSRIYGVMNKAVAVNSALKMINEEFRRNDIGVPLRYGIGVSCGEVLVIEAGSADQGISDFVWIGEAAALASNMADAGSKNGAMPIVVSEEVYDAAVGMGYDPDSFEQRGIKGIGVAYTSDLHYE